MRWFLGIIERGTYENMTRGLEDEIEGKELLNGTYILYSITLIRFIGRGVNCQKKQKRTVSGSSTRV